MVDEKKKKNGVVLYVSYSYFKNTTDFEQIHGIARIDFAEGKREMFADGLDCSAIRSALQATSSILSQRVPMIIIIKSSLLAITGGI